MGNPWIENDYYEPRNPTQPKTVYRADNGDDSKSGETQGTAVLTRTKALADAALLNPTTQDPVAISSDSAEVIDSENTVLIDFVEMNEPNSTVRIDNPNPALEMATGAGYTGKTVQQDGAGSVAILFNGVLLGECTLKSIAAADGVAVLHEQNSVGCSLSTRIMAFGDKGVHNTSNIPDVFNVICERFFSSKPNGIMAHQDSICEMSINGTYASDEGETGCKGLYSEQGRLVSRLDVLDFPNGNCIESVSTGEIDHRGSSATGNIIIGAGTTANIEITNFDHSTYTVTVDGTLNGNIGGVRYGTYAISTPDSVNVEKWEDFGTPAAGKITLDSSKIYKVFGLVQATTGDSIDPNGATIVGASSRSFDGIISSIANHNLIETSSDTVLENMTLTASGLNSELFNISGSGTETFLCDNCKLENNTSLGTIEDMGRGSLINSLVTGSSNGLTVEDLGSWSHRQTSWLEDNTASAYISHSGTFSILAYQGAGMLVSAGNIGIDNSGITSITGYGQINGGFSFDGAGDPVDNVTLFEDKEWSVDAFGIDRIYKDTETFGNLSKNGSSPTPIAAVNTPVKISGPTTLGEVFRADDGGASNRIRNNSNSEISFDINGFASVDNVAGFLDEVSVYVAINGVVQTASRSTSNLGSFLSIMSIPINHTFVLPPGGYAEVWISNDTDTTNLIVARMNYTVKS